jgi:hypothetical protein
VRGTDVTIISDPEGDHSSVVLDKLPEAIDFMKARQ